MKELKLIEKSDKCVSKVRDYIADKFGVMLTLEQITTIYDQPVKFWEEVDSLEKLERNKLSIKAQGYIHHYFWTRLTGTLAPHSMRSEDFEKIKSITSGYDWETKLHNYEKVINERFKSSF